VWNYQDASTGGDNQTDVKSFASRFGARGETDLGNGLTGFGRYEWDVDFNNDTGGGGEDDISLRHRYVGLKGDFGSVLLGQTYQTFYNFVVGPNDNPWWHSGYAMVNYRGRTDNAVTYAGSAGDFNFGATIYMYNDPNEEDIDQWEVGGSMGIGDLTLALAAQGAVNSDTAQGSVGDDDTIYGASLTGLSFGMVTMGFGAQMQHDDTSGLIDVAIGNAYVHLEVLDTDADSAASYSGDDETHVSLTLGYTQTLGRKTLIYYEINNTDNDSGNSDDDHQAVMAVLKYDII
jgi:predicted porin